MDTKANHFKTVTLAAFGGKLIQRVVFKEIGDVLLVCKKSELESAIAENREPTCVGFRREHLRDSS